VYEIESLALVI